MWTWKAIDADSKLIIGWNVADRSLEAAKDFMLDIAARLKNRVQLTTDGYKPYLEAVYGAFDLDYDIQCWSRSMAAQMARVNENGNTVQQNSPEVKTCGYQVNQMKSTFLPVI